MCSAAESREITGLSGMQPHFLLLIQFSKIPSRKSKTVDSSTEDQRGRFKTPDRKINHTKETAGDTIHTAACMFFLIQAFAVQRSPLKTMLMIEAFNRLSEDFLHAKRPER